MRIARLLLCVMVVAGSVSVSSCSKKDSGKKAPIEAARSEFLRQISQWKQVPVKYQSAAFRVIPRLEGAVRFLEGRKSVDVPYLLEAELRISRKPDADVELKVVWLESEYLSSEIRFYIGSETRDVKFPVEVVNENVLVPLEEIERGLVMHGVLSDDRIEWVDIGPASNTNAADGVAESPSIPAELVTGPSRLSVIMQGGKESNSVEVFIHPDVRDLVAKKTANEQPRE